jgi:hypothetical protein
VTAAHDRQGCRFRDDRYAAGIPIMQQSLC